MQRRNSTSHHSRPRDNRRGAPARFAARRAGPVRRGFTLIEILVVILILSVLVSLVVGVSNTVRIEVARRRTVTIQSLLKSAIGAYRETHSGAAPAETQGPFDSGANAFGGGYGAGPQHNDLSIWSAQVRNSDLYVQLISGGDPAILKFIQALPPEAVYNPTMPFRGQNGRYRLFRDGFDNDMDYRLTGAGGTPVTISAGPDGKFGGTNGVYDNDNIYSDGRGQ